MPYSYWPNSARVERLGVPGPGLPIDLAWQARIIQRYCTTRTMRCGRAETLSEIAIPAGGIMRAARRDALPGRFSADVEGLAYCAFVAVAVAPT